ncbi:MAG: response regulator [Rhodospirillaceae bacterium]
MFGKMRLKALVIDDSRSCRILLKDMLERMGCSVFEAENGRHGEKLATSLSPDIIFCDLFMPDQDGLETILKIRKIDKKVPIVVISSGGPDSEMDYLRYATLLGATRALPKPASYDSIERLMDTFFLIDKRASSADIGSSSIRYPANEVSFG